MSNICTIGYERAAFSDLAATLVGAGVTLVIDVRAQPHSRRREYAYKHLGPALADHGIRYQSWPALGTPAAGREAAKRGDMATFYARFAEQLATPEAGSALESLLALASSERPCLLCYERDPAHCHRSLIVERLLREQPDLQVQDLFVDQGVPRSGWQRDG